MLLPILLTLLGCGTEPAATPDTPAQNPEWSSDPAPGFMSPTSPDVDGAACAWTPGQWAGAASDLLDARWVDVGSLEALGLPIRSPADLRAWLKHYGADSFEAQRAALALNIAMDDAGVFGIYADLPGARLLTGSLGGSTAREVLELADDGDDPVIREAMGAFNAGFAGCDPDWYVTCDVDLDNDGVPVEHDCDDLDDGIGTLLHADDLSVDTGYLTPSATLDGEWVWGGDSVLAVEGGQQAMLGEAETWRDYVVRSTLTAKGTEPGCGFECAEACGEYVPEDGCYSDWQALGLGILTMELTGTGVATFRNSGAYDVCFDGYLMWSSPSSQGLTIGEEVLEDETYRVPAGGSLSVYYGSWTTANGSYQPYLGRPPLWCYQNGTAMAIGTDYATTGALLPEDLQVIISDDSDLDLDGREDHVDWAGSSGVQTQYNVWNHQQTHAAVAVGKLAASTAEGTVRVTLTVENRGAVATTAEVTDIVPEDWNVVACSDAPDTTTPGAGGTEAMAWSVPLDGCTSNCAVYDSYVITCDLAYNLHADRDIVELDPAFAAFFDGDDYEVSWSMPAAAFDFDHDMDGAVLCGSTDRWRAGVLARSELDLDQGEGFHGYRCALASNAADDCFPEGTFLQIAEFMDAEEDDISSECEENCPEDPTFDQLARVDHTSIDLLAGDATLSFWVVGDQLVCEATQGDVTVRATAVDATFSAGATGMSTLNAFGDYDDVQVCEAYKVPE